MQKTSLRAPALRTNDELKLLRGRMARQDRLQPEWRNLIYEHGQVRVFQLIDAGFDPDDAIAYLT